MFFRPLFIDVFWPLVIDVFLTLATDRQTNSFYFIWPSLQSREQRGVSDK
jgi:hypothetical protein